VILGDGTNQVSGTEHTVNNGDTLTGGTGTDTLTIDTGPGIDHTYVFGDGATGHSDIGLTNFENLTLTDANADAGHEDAITIVFDSDFQNKGSLTVDGSALHNLTGTNLTVDAHLATHDSFVFIGSASADTLIGGSHNDIITGGGGGDTLTGGGGSDTFVFKAVTDSQASSGNFDTITDFTAGSDHVDLSAISGLNDNNQTVNFLSLASTPTAIDAHTIAIVTSGGTTTIYANASGASENIGSADVEVHLNNVTNVQSTDFILHH
jgi:Ca2+-binding RTX toxin-like protein